MNNKILPVEIDNLILSFLGCTNFNLKQNEDKKYNFNNWLNNIITSSLKTPSAVVMNKYIKSYNNYCGNFFIYSFDNYIFSLATRSKDNKMMPYFKLYEDIKYMYDWDERIEKYGALMKKYNKLYYHSRIIN